MSLQENRAACAACLACNRESAVPTFCGPGKSPEQSRAGAGDGAEDGTLLAEKDVTELVCTH